MHTHRSRRVLCWALLSLVIAASVPAGTSAQTPSDEALSSAVDTIARKTLSQPGAVGLSVAVARGDRIILSRGFGLAELEHQVRADAETMFRIGSVTKQFSAAAVMRLVDQGKLSLDDTLDKVLPDYPKTTKPVTIRHILTHTSGIWSYTDDEKFMQRDAGLDLTPTELVALFKDKPLEFDPGSRWNYSNSAYYLLGPIIERASGKPYPEFLQDEFFGPLGLSRTRYESNDILPNRAQGYTMRHGATVNDRPIGPDVPGAAGSLLSSAGDLVRWELALVSGKVVPAESFKQMKTPAVLTDGKPTDYGFGLQIDRWEGRSRISHGGGIFGFTSMLMYFPPQDGAADAESLCVAVIANTDRLNSGRVAESIARAALGIAEFEPADKSPTADELKAFSGDFKFETIPLAIRFFERDGRVWAQATGQQETRLLYQGNGEFRADFDHAVKFVFRTPSAGEPAAEFTLHQGGGVFKAARKTEK